MLCCRSVRFATAPPNQKARSSRRHTATRDGGGPPRYHPCSRRRRRTLTMSAIGLNPDALFCASALERIPPSFSLTRSQSCRAIPVRGLRGTALHRSRYEVALVGLSFTRSTYWRNAFGSRTAMSASTFRSRSTPEARIAAMRRLYDTPASREAALMRAIHSERNCVFFLRRSRKAYVSACIAASRAGRTSLRFVARRPSAALRSFLCFLCAATPRLIRVIDRLRRYRFGRSLRMSLISPFATTPLPACRRLRAGDLCWFKCPLYAFMREILPVPVTRNRFFAPLWLFCLGTA